MAARSADIENGNSLVDHLRAVFASEVNKYRSVVEKLNDISTVSVLPEDKKEHQNIVQQHEKYRLAAQLRVVEKSSSLALPSGERCVLKLTEEHFENETYDSKELLRYLEYEKTAEEDKRRVLDGELEREQKTLAMVEQQCSSDGISYEAVEGSAGNGGLDSPALEPARNLKISQLEEKLKKLKILNTSRCKQWRDFLEKNFPPADDYDQESSSDELFRWEESKDKRSLADIINDLVTSYLDPVSNSYIQIDSSMWEPHVEFLLRCGLAVRNPNNPSLLRLEKFAD